MKPVDSQAFDRKQAEAAQPVVRHDTASLGATLGRSFQLIETRGHDHRTPAGGIQRFQFSRFRRID